MPAPAQALAADVADKLTPSVNQLTQSLLALIPSPPPPPPPPTVITALAPLEEARATASSRLYRVSQIICKTLSQVFVLMALITMFAILSLVGSEYTCERCASRTLHRAGGADC